MKRQLILLLGFCLLLPVIQFGQTNVYKKKSAGISKEVGTYISYTKSGITTGIGINLKKSNHQVGFGVRSVPNYPASNASKPFGFYTDYRFYTRIKKKSQPFMNAYYGNSFPVKTGNTSSEGKKSVSVSHELYMGYGVCFKLGHLSIAPTLLYGGIIEMKKNPYTLQKTTSVKMSYQLKINVSYDF